jgi:hypothetical protein
MKGHRIGTVTGFSILPEMRKVPGTRCMSQARTLLNHMLACNADSAYRTILLINRVESVKCQKSALHGVHCSSIYAANSAQLRVGNSGDDYGS